MSGRQNSNPSHICFYSNGCKFCKAFIQELSQTPWTGEFRFICADQAQNRPAWLKKVPTLVIAGEQEPRTDAEVMNWLYERKLREGGKMKPQGHQTAAPSMGGDPEAWNGIENGALGDGGPLAYSDINADTSTTSDSKGNISIAGTYSFLHGAASMGDRTSDSLPGAGAMGVRKSKKEELFDKQMEAYQRERDSGMPRFQQRM
jgi:hypothetical protein